jgi:hypothetical protein
MNRDEFLKKQKTLKSVKYDAFDDTYTEKFRTNAGDQEKMDLRLIELKGYEKEGKVKIINFGRCNGRWGWNARIVYRILIPKITTHLKILIKSK